MCALRIRRSGGGVRGGEDVIRVVALTLKLVTGKSASSSSLCIGEGGLSGTVEHSEIKERLVLIDEANRACFEWWMGDDSGR